MNKRPAVHILFTISVAVLLFALSEQGSAWSRIVRGEAFELIGPGGQIRARLNLESDGNVVLRLMDEEGTIRVKLGASRKGSGLVLLNESTEVGVHLLADGSIRLKNRDGREKVIIP